MAIVLTAGRRSHTVMDEAEAVGEYVLGHNGHPAAILIDEQSRSAEEDLKQCKEPAKETRDAQLCHCQSSSPHDAGNHIGKEYRNQRLFFTNSSFCL
ncbi:hypothetical protein [Bacillus sp. PK3_68]|nr:hypothetical protein [Bacillus sp. PK3_68]